MCYPILDVNKDTYIKNSNFVQHFKSYSDTPIPRKIISFVLSKPNAINCKCIFAKHVINTLSTYDFLELQNIIIFMTVAYK